MLGTLTGRPPGRKKKRESLPCKSSARRPRSCRDTAIALSSGLGKDSSFVHAIQRGLNAALRLTGQTTPEKECPNVPSNGKSAPASFSSPSSSSSAAGAAAAAAAASALELCDKSVKVSSRSAAKRSGKTVAKPSPAKTAAESLPCKDSAANRNEIATQLQLLIRKGCSSSTTKSVAAEEPAAAAASAKGGDEAVVACESPSLAAGKRKKQKKKKKKKTHKSSAHNAETPYGGDPSLQQCLELLCKTLDRCSISRVSLAAGAKLPCIFQCRKYIGGSAALCSASGTGSRYKRRRAYDDVASLLVPAGNFLFKKSILNIYIS